MAQGGDSGDGHPDSRGVACRQCRNLGYRGRIGVYEMLKMSDAMRELVMHRGNTQQIAARAKADGDLCLLKEDGYAKTRAGITTIAEVMLALTV